MIFNLDLLVLLSFTNFVSNSQPSPLRISIIIKQALPLKLFADKHGNDSSSIVHTVDYPSGHFLIVA